MTIPRPPRIRILLFIMLLLGSIDIWFYVAEVLIYGTGDTFSHILKAVSILLLVMLGTAALRLQEAWQLQKRITTELEQQRFAIDQHAIVSITDARGNIIYANDRFCEISGYRREDLMGHNHRLLKSGVHPDSFYREMWETAASGRVWQGEVCNRRRDGSLYWVSSTIVPYLDERGRPWQYASIRTDITAIKDAEARIEENRQFLYGITDAMGEGVYALDTQGRATFINKEAERLLGWSQIELIGKNMHDMTHAVRADGSHLPFDECPVRMSMVRGETFRSSTEVFTTKRGELIPIEMVASPLLSRGKAVGSVAIFRDIRDQIRHKQELEQARDAAVEASRLKSEFLSTMSHEIRTPMNGVIGMADLLLDTPLDTQQREFAGTILDSAHALLDIINDILDFSKIEAGKLEVEHIPFQLLPVFEGSLDLLATKAREKNLLLISQLDLAIPASVIGDPGRLRQILLNLVNNAIKFTASGHVALIARATAPGRVRFEVQDTGIGMSDAIAGKLFQPFTQADGSVTRKYGGTGLGLSICKRLVELMGGQIGVESVEGRGSTFWLEIPLGASEDAEAGTALPERLQQLELMLVSDDTAHREALGLTLQGLGLNVTCLDGEDAALAHLVEGARPAAALTLASPHDSDNAAMAQRLLAAHPDLSLILLARQRHQVEEAASLGYHAGLLQPARRASLVEALLQATDRRRVNVPVAHDRRVEVARAAAPVVDAGRELDQNRLVLLVEDNVVNQKVAVNMINKLGYAAHVASDGMQAVEVLECLPYALVLMDCQMPVMDGFEATRRIRKQESAGRKRVPIIAMTANAMPGDRQRCLEAGMDDYLSKPIDPADLESLLLHWLGPSHATLHTDDEPAAAAAPDNSLVNLSRLRDMFGDDQETIAELLEVFVQSTGTLLEKQGLAVSQSAWSDLKALGHQMAGSAGNLGITSLQDQGRAMERAAAAEDIGQATALHASMLQTLRTLAELIHHGLK